MTGSHPVVYAGLSFNHEQDQKLRGRRGQNFSQGRNALSRGTCTIVNEAGPLSIYVQRDITCKHPAQLSGRLIRMGQKKKKHKLDHLTNFNPSCFAVP
jgi:hypothetical protein